MKLVLESDVVLHLSNLLTVPNEDLRLESAWYDRHYSTNYHLLQPMKLNSNIYLANIMFCRCLTNIAAGDHTGTRQVLAAVPNMMPILDGTRDSVALQDQICWAIGNIAGDCDEFRTILLANGCLMVITKFLQARISDIVEIRKSETWGAFDSTAVTAVSPAQTAAWALSNLARGKISSEPFVTSG